jgi:hypothetical protein
MQGHDLIRYVVMYEVLMSLSSQIIRVTSLEFLKTTELDLSSQWYSMVVPTPVDLHRGTQF